MAADQDSTLEKAYIKAVRTDQELAIINEQIDAPDVNVSYGTLFRYASLWDIALIIFGSLSAIAAGSALPLMTVCLPLLLYRFALSLTTFQTAHHR